MNLYCNCTACIKRYVLCSIIKLRYSMKDKVHFNLLLLLQSTANPGCHNDAYINSMYSSIYFSFL